ncbi:MULTISPECIES: HNH endonuclease [unclassified Streptomyces]|uniref:HNH endonuclease n=1 Tax=unclassified Streptomyces TaxID=2593676 RepID=UPI000DD8D398|nr:MULTISPECIES: HNH endonuclease [unclassified Streptomyces]QZZ28031.1 HNH endonuclease [Streptomyces sp. ST1015]
MAEGQGLLERVGQLRPVERRTLPLFLLWAISQVLHGRSRLRPWSEVKQEVGPLLERFAGVQSEQEVVEPFWTLQRHALWEVAEAEGLPSAGARRQPTFADLEEANPDAGLSEQDYNLLRGNAALATEAVATLIVRFFATEPGVLMEALELPGIPSDQLGYLLRPLVGEAYGNRTAIREVYGGNGTMGITPLTDGILAVYSDATGPYPDQVIPETGWIAYTGDGLRGHQRLIKGNRSMAQYQKEEKALRYWHQPHQGSWSFESWVVIVQCRRRWGVGEDGVPRREYVWVLAPVPSPLRETWPKVVLEALEEDDKTVQDDSEDIVPAEAEVVSDGRSLTDKERYQRLAAAAHRAQQNRSEVSKLTKVERYVRSAAAREAVLTRCGGRCENPDCSGHSSERTDADKPILDVDHVNGLARTKEDTPEVMIALCPNCHALKTRGKNRRALEKLLRAEARKRHLAME